MEIRIIPSAGSEVRMKAWEFVDGFEKFVQEHGAEGSPLLGYLSTFEAQDSQEEYPLDQQWADQEGM